MSPINSHPVPRRAHATSRVYDFQTSPATKRESTHSFPFGGFNTLAGVLFHVESRLCRMQVKNVQPRLSTKLTCAKIKVDQPSSNTTELELANFHFLALIPVLELFEAGNKDRFMVKSNIFTLAVKKY